MTGTKFLLHGDESKNSKMVMMAASSKDDDTISDEEWLVSRARMCIKSDPFAAKSWMITAKSLFPHNFTIQVRLTNITSVAHAIVLFRKTSILVVFWNSSTINM
jgi:hypothetical protein